MYRMQITCIVIIIFMAIIYFAVRRRKTYSHYLFVFLNIVTLVNLILDMATVYTVNHLDTVSLFWNNVLHRLFIGSMVGTLFLTFCYCMSLISKEVRRSEKPHMFWFIPLAISLMGVLVLPIKYVETPNGNYSAGPAAIMAYISVGFYLLVSYAFLIRFWKAVNVRKRNVIVLALSTELAVAVFQAFYPTSLISGLGITILNLSLFLTVESPDVHLIEKLEEETEHANAANKAKSSFIANISHEIRTPLGAVLGMNEMILRESEEPQIREYATMAKSSALTLHGIIDDVLDFSKIESGKMEIIPVEYDLCSMLSDLVHMISVRVKDRGLNFAIHVEQDLPTKIYGDDVRIRQILTNLLTNAVKYTPQGTVTLNVTGQQNQDEIIFHYEVSDTGIGIRKEDLALLFVAFERIEESRNRHIEGTGLGVNITLQLLEMMGSTLNVSSEYGKGSCFSFDLKQKVIAPTTIGDFEEKLKNVFVEKKYKASFYAPKAQILMVDDNEMNRIVFSGLLKETGVTIEEAKNGFECLELVQKKHYDIIFMDHMMPNMDGIETLERMKAMEESPSHDSPVVILTANAVAGAKEMYRAKGFEDFLAKPIVPEKLETCILKFLPNAMLENPPKEIRIPVETGKKEEKEELPIVNGIDWEWAKIHFPNQELLLEMVKQFYKMIETECQSIREDCDKALEQKNSEDYRIRVHAMKSSAALIGAFPIAGLSRILEEAAKENNWARMEELTPILLNELEKMKERLGDLVGTQEQETIKDWASVTKLLTSLKEACELMDLSMMDEQMEKVNQLNFPDNMKEMIQQLGARITYLETEEAVELLEKILQITNELV